MEATESNTSRRKLEVMSTVTEHSADIGAELSDTITVSGFPADHGQYAGNEEYEFAADRPYATVSVWGSGDPDNPSNDEAYKPSGGEVPTEDDNHRLLATWEIPAMNGTFKIGAGALDAHGAPMYLTAERPGWYVFVWRFEGDDRVSPASSRYDDAWERVRAPYCPSSFGGVVAMTDSSTGRCAGRYVDPLRHDADDVGWMVNHTPLLSRRTGAGHEVDRNIRLVPGFRFVEKLHACRLPWIRQLKIRDENDETFMIADFPGHRSCLIAFHPYRHGKRKGR